VLVVASALMWIPCLLVLLVGAPLLVTGLLGLSAGTMTVQVVGSRGGTSRFSRWAERAFRC
jgi:hypothetical protein